MGRMGGKGWSCIQGGASQSGDWLEHEQRSILTPQAEILPKIACEAQLKTCIKNQPTKTSKCSSICYIYSIRERGIAGLETESASSTGRRRNVEENGIETI
mmetsp:Transcript_3653/g.7567  ORF Transcript_3653/g.7567 Transcript_3653/m.7567 type:complete len:101 (+) Transcript_3653:1123-1425(+)